MLLRVIASVVLVSSAVICEPGITRDVDVFDKHFNRRQHNARDLVFRVFDPIPPRPEPTWKASATLSSDNPEQSMTGEITFKQWNINAPIMVSMNISGLPAGKHSVHIHAFGDVSDGCKSTGPHFRASIVGNVEAKQDEDIDVTYETWGLNLFGLTGILGRSVVIHEKPSGESTFSASRALRVTDSLPEYLRYPDLFSPEAQFLDDAVSYQTEEDAVGERLACGVITITSNI